MLKNRQILFLIFLTGFLLITFFIQTFFIKKPKIFKSKASETANLILSSNKSSVSQGEDFTITVKVSPSANFAIQAYKVYLTFNRNDVLIKDSGITYLRGDPSTNLGAHDNTSITSINAGTGTATINLIGEIQSIAGLTLTANIAIPLVEVTFVARTNQRIEIGSTSQSKLIKINSDYTLTDLPLSVTSFVLNQPATPTPTSTQTPTPTPNQSLTPTSTLTPTQTPTPTPNQSLTSTSTSTPTQASGGVSLNLKLKFQGIMQPPAGSNQRTMPVKIKVGGGNLTQPITVSANFSFTTNRNSDTDPYIWQGSVNLPSSVTPGNNYYLLVKGPKHIQKRICTNSPSETSPGSYRCFSGQIQLQSGVNNLDFSKVYLLAGDMPVSGGQDGVVDSLDTSYIRNNLGKTDSGVLAIADLNLDGKVDTQDWSLVIAALSVRADEE
jgi:hypothetical protein